MRILFFRATGVLFVILPMAAVFPVCAQSVSRTTPTGQADQGLRRAGSAQRAPRADSKTRSYAQSMLRGYDKNQNGKLEKEEWTRMRDKYHPADVNSDGIITLHELTERVASLIGGKSGASGNRSGAATSPRSGANDKRLPKDLPGWFARCDGNGDGQVAMAEYSSTWSESKAAEFAKHDTNGDGVVTTKECLAPEKDRQRSKTRKKLSPAKKPGRVGSTARRLPDGLPDWFARCDRDGDGQVAMAEYSSTWSESKAAEFAKHDTNGDGVITQKECPAPEKGQESRSSQRSGKKS